MVGAAGHQPATPESGPASTPYGARDPVDGVALAALICSLTLVAAPLGIVLGMAGLVRTATGKSRGRWAALVGLAVGLAVTVVAAYWFRVFTSDRFIVKLQ